MMFERFMNSKTCAAIMLFLFLTNLFLGIEGSGINLAIAVVMLFLNVPKAIIALHFRDKLIWRHKENDVG